MSYELLWLRAFALTCLIEVPIYMFVLRRALPDWRWRLLLAFGLQVATHPALWFVAPRFDPYWAWLVVMELCVFAVEAAGVALALRLRPTPRRVLGLALFAAFAANAVSTLVGLAILLAGG